MCGQISQLLTMHGTRENPRNKNNNLCKNNRFNKLSATREQYMSVCKVYICSLNMSLLNIIFKYMNANKLAFTLYTVQAIVYL